MKFKVLVSGLVAAFFVASAAPSLAADPKFVLPEAARAAPDGRALQILVGQEEIKSDINPSNVSVAMGGGMLAALIDAKIQADRAKAAEIAIQPVRVALAGFDADTLATEAANATLAKLPWFQASPITLGRDTSIPGRIAVLDAGGGQTAFFTYAYDMSPDFSAVRVSVTIQIVNKAIPEGKSPESRFTLRNLVFTQTVTSIVVLPNPSTVAVDNANVWSADGGKLARQALTTAFAELGVLTPRVFDLTAVDAKAMMGKTHKYVMLGGYGGRDQGQVDGGTLMFNGGLGGFIHVQTLTPQ